MRWIHVGAAAAVLFVGPALADDAQQTAAKTMHEAMAQQVSMPATPPVMPDHSATDQPAGHDHTAMQQGHDAQQKAQMQHTGEMQQKHAMEQAAHQHAVMQGTKDANSLRADMANKAAMGAAMGGATMDHGDSNCQDPAGMMRTTNPTGGMMGGGGMTGGSGSGGGMMPITAGTGTGTGTTTGTGSMPAGSTR